MREASSEREVNRAKNYLRRKDGTLRPDGKGVKRRGVIISYVVIIRFSKLTNSPSLRSFVFSFFFFSNASYQFSSISKFARVFSSSRNAKRKKMSRERGREGEKKIEFIRQVSWSFHSQLCTV